MNLGIRRTTGKCKDLDIFLGILILGLGIFQHKTRSIHHGLWIQVRWLPWQFTGVNSPFPGAKGWVQFHTVLGLFILNQVAFKSPKKIITPSGNLLPSS